MFQSIISGVSRLSRRSAASTKMTLLHDVDVPTKKATFALGCFWAPDSFFGTTKGVIRTRVGFTGGSKDLPQYRNLGDHTEAIELDYDPNEITYDQLLNIFWTNHDPTSRTTRQYTSIIFYHDDEQKEKAERTLKEQQAKRQSTVVTTVVPAKTFYNAEDYHQKYRLQQHPFLMKAVELKPTIHDLTRSHVAARLNGYVVGQGGIKQFEEEKDKLGFNEEVAEYVRKLVVKYKDHGLFC